MKKIFFSLCALLLFMTGCTSTEENTAPVIEGASGIECIVNTTVDLLDGVVAYDKEDGDITPHMEIHVFPEVQVWDGYAIFDKAGNYKITYGVEDSAGNSVEKLADITVSDRELYMDFAGVNGFYTKVSGHAVLENGGMRNGKYSVVARDCEVAEDVAIQRVYELDKGTTYTFFYTLSSETSGRIRILIDGALAEEKMIAAGENIISFTYDTKVKNTITVALLLGGLGETISCELKKVSTECAQEAGLVELAKGFSVAGRFDGTAKGNAYAIQDGTAAKLEITQSSAETWQGGMFLELSIPMEVGREYVVSFEITRKESASCVVSLQNQQWDEKKYGDISIEGDRPATSHRYAFTVTEENKGSLWLYVQSGKSVNEIILSNLSVQTILEGTKKEEFPLSDFTNSNEGFQCELETFAGGFKYFIEAFGEIDYQQKITSPVFYLNGSGKNFVISFKAKATKPTEVVFAAPYAGGWDPTWVWQRFTITEEEKVYTFFGSEAGSDRENVFVWQFGSVKNQKYHNVTIEISDIKISYKNSEYDGD